MFSLVSQAQKTNTIDRKLQKSSKNVKKMKKNEKSMISYIIEVVVWMG